MQEARLYLNYEDIIEDKNLRSGRKTFASPIRCSIACSGDLLCVLSTIKEQFAARLRA